MVREYCQDPFTILDCLSYGSVVRLLVSLSVARSQSVGLGFGRSRLVGLRRSVDLGCSVFVGRSRSVSVGRSQSVDMFGSVNWSARFFATNTYLTPTKAQQLVQPFSLLDIY